MEEGAGLDDIGTDIWGATGTRKALFSIVAALSGRGLCRDIRVLPSPNIAKFGLFGMSSITQHASWIPDASCKPLGIWQNTGKSKNDTVPTV
jgi:hypothetical protein